MNKQQNGRMTEGEGMLSQLDTTLTRASGNSPSKTVNLRDPFQVCPYAYMHMCKMCAWSYVYVCMAHTRTIYICKVALSVCLFVRNLSAARVSRRHTPRPGAFTLSCYQ